MADCFSPSRLQILCKNHRQYRKYSLHRNFKGVSEGVSASWKETYRTWIQHHQIIPTLWKQPQPQPQPSTAPSEDATCPHHHSAGSPTQRMACRHGARNVIPKRGAVISLRLASSNRTIRSRHTLRASWCKNSMLAATKALWPTPK